MAKTRRDYKNAGAAVAREFIKAGKMLAEGYPVSGLNGVAITVSLNGSWQAMAWKQGFNAVRSKQL